MFTWFSECTLIVANATHWVNLFTLAIFVYNKTEYLIFIIYFVVQFVTIFFSYCFSYFIDIVFLSSLYSKTELQNDPIWLYYYFQIRVRYVKPIRFVCDTLNGLTSNCTINFEHVTLTMTFDLFLKISTLPITSLPFIGTFWWYHRYWTRDLYCDLLTYVWKTSTMQISFLL